MTKKEEEKNVDTKADGSDALKKEEPIEHVKAVKPSAPEPSPLNADSKSSDQNPGSSPEVLATKAQSVPDDSNQREFEPN